MHRAALTLTLALSLAVTACGGDDDTGTAPTASSSRAELTPCSEVLAPGRPTDDVVADVEAGPCLGDDGSATSVVLASYSCADGQRQLYSHDDTRGVSGGTWEEGPNQLGLC